jgi:hypothetical protein
MFAGIHTGVVACLVRCHWPPSWRSAGSHMSFGRRDAGLRLRTITSDSANSAPCDCRLPAPVHPAMRPMSTSEGTPRRVAAAAIATTPAPSGPAQPPMAVPAAVPAGAAAAAPSVSTAAPTPPAAAPPAPAAAAVPPRALHVKARGAYPGAPAGVARCAVADEQACSSSALCMLRAGRLLQCLALTLTCYHVSLCGANLLYAGDGCATAA